jgi:hypothetical protein
VSSDGAFIAILGGSHYIVDAVDRAETSTWLEADDVVVCDPGPGEDVKLIDDGNIVHAHHASE